MAELEKHRIKRRYEQAVRLGKVSGEAAAKSSRGGEFGGQAIDWLILQHNEDVESRPETPEVKAGLEEGFKRGILGQ